ncbi:hypothetical protein [Streptomyces sp. NPDC056069]|uniref:hypothetical protein n=1 Tax=Streptomyces sp. NPDC056069 TaxID=3345702 RepID=UPI0035DC3E38
MESDIAELEAQYAREMDGTLRCALCRAYTAVVVDVHDHRGADEMWAIVNALDKEHRQRAHPEYVRIGEELAAARMRNSEVPPEE